MSLKKNEVKKYLSLPWENEYKITRIPEEDGGGFSVSIPLLGEKRCRADGDTIDDAIKHLAFVLQDMIEDYLERGLPIPLPEEDRNYSGTLIIRTTSSLHSQIARKARQAGVSINHLVTVFLERGLAGYTVERILEEKFQRHFWMMERRNQEIIYIMEKKIIEDQRIPHTKIPYATIPVTGGILPCSKGVEFNTMKTMATC